MHGAGVDEPLVWYQGSGLTDRRWLIPDWQGTIVAHVDAAGATERYTYGPYGEPHAWGAQTTLARFRYTGQAALPEVALYHYKARVYDPVLGRFLQTDPVGYQDDLNLYAYVRNDPLNNSDPTGMALVCDDQGNCRETVDIVVTAQRPQLTQEQFSSVSKDISNVLARDAAENYVAPTLVAGAGGAALNVAFRGGQATVVAFGDEIAAAVSAIARSPSVQGAATTAAADLIAQAVEPSRTGPVDLGQTARSGIAGAVGGGAIARTPGLTNQAVVGAGVAATGAGFIDPSSTVQDRLVSAAIGGATATARAAQSFFAGVAEGVFGHPDERR